ncbi:uncharacterized protein LOC109546552 [Dendroctonus ponderosae]
MYYFGVLVLLSYGAVASAKVSSNSVLCFECSPQVNAGNCIEPAKSLTPRNCSIHTPGFSVACYSEFLIHNNVSGNTARNNRTGIYRGCYSYHIGSRTEFDYCSKFPGLNVTRQYCETCNGSRCNHYYFNNAVDGVRVATSGVGFPKLRARGGSTIALNNNINFILTLSLGLLISDIIITGLY